MDNFYELKFNISKYFFLMFEIYHIGKANSVKIYLRPFKVGAAVGLQIIIHGLHFEFGMNFGKGRN